MTSAPSVGPPQARDPADDEHGKGQERELEVDVLDADRAGVVDEEAAREPGQSPGEREGPQTLPVNVDPCCLSGGGVLSGRPKLAAERAALIREGDADNGYGADGRLPEIGRLGHGRERERARADLLPVADDVVGDSEHREGRDSARRALTGASAGTRRAGRRQRRPQRPGEATPRSRACGPESPENTFGRTLALTSEGTVNSPAA